MASTARITQVLPETLPGDFVQWDEASWPAQPVQPGSGEPEPGVGVAPNPATQAAEAQRSGTPSRNVPRGALSVSAHGSTGGEAAPRRAQSLSPAPLSSRDIVGQLQAGVPAIEEFRFSAPRPNGAPAAATMTAFDGILPHPLWANAVEITRAARKKWPIIAGASAALVVILAAAMIPVFNRGTVPSAKSAAAPAPTASSIRQPDDAAPMRADSTRKVRASAATTAGKAQITSEAARRPVQKDAGPSWEQAQMMDDQLHTPTRLQLKATPAEQASLLPRGPAAADIQGSDNSNTLGAVFGSPKQPRVQMAAQELITIPPAVALSLLIQKTQPVYPSIAKMAQVSGTVVLAATISETGHVQNLRIVDGPEMLRRSAFDAVRTWRFKPYIVRNKPTAIQTTINVHFTIH